MYDLGCMLVELRPFMVLDGLPGLYGLKYDSATAYEMPLYLCSYKLISSATDMACVQVRLMMDISFHKKVQVKRTGLEISPPRMCHD